MIPPHVSRNPARRAHWCRVVASARLETVKWPRRELHRGELSWAALGRVLCAQDSWIRALEWRPASCSKPA